MSLARLFSRENESPESQTLHLRLWAPAFAGALALTGCAATPVRPDEPRPVVVDAPPPTPSVPGGMQFLYGSGEAAALSQQAYTVLVDHVRQWIAAQPRKLRPGQTPGPRASVVLAPGSTLEQSTFVPCGDKPLAAVFDMDETAVLNLGFEYDDAQHPGNAYDAARWSRWEQTGADAVAAVPGAVEAFGELRRMGVTVVINTNRSIDSAGPTARALTNAGLGDFKHGETLFLQGDDATGSHKDGRRAAIAARYCVVAMAGDQLTDFSDLFAGPPAARRAAVQSPALHGLFGRFWFVLPNPVYGAGIKGGFDDVFPADKRWVDPGSGAK